MTDNDKRSGDFADNGRRKRSDAPAVAALACGKSLREAADLSGLSESTINRRLQDPAFVQKVEDAKTDIVNVAVDEVRQASAEAAETLRALLASCDERIRLSAAKTLMEIVLRLREHSDFDALRRQIEQLERMVGLVEP